MDDDHEYGLNASDSNVNGVESRMEGKYVEEDDDEEEEVNETNVGDNELNETTQQNGDDNVGRYDEDENDDDDDDGEDNDHMLQRHPKKRKLKSLLLSYEFAPRVPPPTSARKPSYGRRNTLTDWSEDETFVLLDAWGERYIKCGRKSLRSEEWLEVADRVSQESKMERTDTQCRNRLDTLKKKYKKEKANLIGNRIANTKWVYFKKIDTLLSPGTSAFKTAGVNINNTNGVDQTWSTTRGISGNSYSHDDDDDDDSDLLPLKKPKVGGSFKLLADSINKFSEIYEKIENNKIQQMIELEKMKMEFHKDLELQKRQLLDRAQQGDYEDNNDVSAENISRCIFRGTIIWTSCRLAASTSVA
ncbi:putative transcription factor MYB family [Helianthus annuus]|nr:putative transcription factor MYB family [Helianthus annuus]KAJ0639416.1 putative transcription factor MYB family [Helianthus annuus]KAJ0643399.1 putative transcription factor MYB family [Helianthus annuus]KAJ0819489.1 putative transcription factor MYB family [Helianthus annuus]